MTQTSGLLKILKRKGQQQLTIVLEDMVAPGYDATAVFSLPMIDRGITFSDSFSDWSIAGECCIGCVPGSGCIDACNY